MIRRAERRGQKGQSTIEALVGSMLLIPICLLGINAVTCVLTNSVNDNLAKSAARAAANQQSKVAAEDAAKQCISHFPKSAIILDVQLADAITYVDKKHVAVKTTMQIKLPASFAGFDKLQFNAQAVEPIVGVPADV